MVAAQPSPARTVSSRRCLAWGGLILLAPLSPLGVGDPPSRGIAIPTPSASNASPRQTLTPSLVVQLGYTQMVSGSAISPDGTLAVAGSFSGTTRLWHLPTGSELRRFDGHTAGVVAAAFSPDGRHVLTASYDGSARLWDPATGEEVFRFVDESGALPSSVSFSSDGRRFVVGQMGGPTRLFDRETGEELLSLMPEIAGGPHAAISRDASQIITAGVSPGLQLWSAGTGELLTTFGTETPPLNGAIAFSPEGDRVFAGHTDGLVRAWDLATGEVVQTFRGHTGGVSALGLSLDGSVLMTTSQTDGLAIVWDVESTTERHRWGGGGGHLWAAAMSADGTRVLGGSVIALTLWDATDGSVEQQLEGFSNRISNVGFSADGRRILVSDLGFGVHLWNQEAGTRDTRLIGMDAAFARDTAITVVVSPSGEASVYDATVDTLIGQFSTGSGVITAFAVARDGTLLATNAAGQPAIRLWDAEAGTELQSLLSSADESVSALTFLPAGDRLVVAGVGVRVWDLESGTSPTWIEDVVALDIEAFPDGRRVVTCGGERVQVIDLETGEVRTFEGHTDFVNAVAVSPDGLLAASVGDDRTVRLWDVATGEAILVMTGHTDRIVDVDFSPDGRHLITGSDDGTARIWDLASGAELASLVAFTDGSWVTLAPDGRFDTDDLEGIRGVHWVMPDAPFTPLPIEIFMRDYFEPRLVGRLMAGEELPPVPDLAALNRVQPRVELVSAEVTVDAVASLIVRVSEGEGFARVGGDSTRVTSGAQDLRLFRDGQLVAWKDGVQSLEADGTTAIRFDGIALPRRERFDSITFTAYAFNDDRVKSATATISVQVPSGVTTRKGRAHVVTVGVDSYESPVWDLRFAAADAWLLSRDLEARLAASGAFEDVVTVPLVSAHEPSETTLATKASIRAVLEALAGLEVPPELRSRIPGGDLLRKATPDDLVFLSFSAHGYRDPDGTFYLFPSDIGSDAEKRVTPELLERAISSEELAGWLRSVDAGEMILVVDACHSAAAVEGAGFKPGPMGSRGLGQLAYDKGMRVLAASQAEDVALESDLINQGLLTYALVRDGLEARQADDPPADGAITLSEWLRYGVQRVPSLYVEVQEGEIQTFGVSGRSVEIGGASADPHFQQPSLFNFRKKGIELSLVRN